MGEGVNQDFKAIAVLSGKGGSGKTMFCAVLMRILDDAGEKVILVDADTGTGGASYYLGMYYVSNIRRGLAEFLTAGTQPALDDFLRPINGCKKAHFLSVGDHHKFTQRSTERANVGTVLERLRTEFATWVLVDCRGGIDDETLDVCRQVDHLILIVESDTTSFQATKHIVKVLDAEDLSGKLHGFVINKVITDATVIAQQDSGQFGCQHLCSIPFDLEATRNFLLGRLPDRNSLFANHAQEAAHRAYPKKLAPPLVDVWTSKDFARLGIVNPDSQRGGILASAALVMMTIVIFLKLYVGERSAEDREFLLFEITPLLSLGCLIGIAGSVSVTRRLLGRLFMNGVRLILAKRAGRADGRPSDDHESREKKLDSLRRKPHSNNNSS